jgi:putative solute:sodium symporter small subunit
MRIQIMNQTKPPCGYWARVRKLTYRVLMVWVVLVFSVVLVAPVLSATVFGIPLSYWLISAFLLPGFLILIVYYAWRMDRLESNIMNSQNK